MKISTRGRYALILMLDLANHNRGVPVPLKETAKRQQISEKYLEQIISVLNKAGFVKSVRGRALPWKRQDFHLLWWIPNRQLNRRNDWSQSRWKG